MQWKLHFWWFRKNWLSRRNPIISYFIRFKNLLLEAILLILAVWAIVLILLYVADLFWHLYLETMMGQKFYLYFPDKAEAIEQTLSTDLRLLSGRITLTAFLFSIGIAAFGRITHINRYFYMSLGLIEKLLYWGIPLTGITSFYIHIKYLQDFNWELTFLLAAFPTYCLFMNCFKYAEKLLPEMEDVLFWARNFGKRVWSLFKIITKKII